MESRSCRTFAGVVVSSKKWASPSDTVPTPMLIILLILLFPRPILDNVSIVICDDKICDYNMDFQQQLIMGPALTENCTEGFTLF